MYFATGFEYTAINRLKYYIDRLLSIPMSETNYGKEKAHIEHLASMNGFDRGLIDKLLGKRLRKMICRKDEPDNKVQSSPYWCDIPYVGALSEKIGHALKRNNINVAFTKSTSLRNHL